MSAAVAVEIPADQPLVGDVVEPLAPVEDSQLYAELVRRLFGCDQLPGDPGAAAHNHRDAFSRAARLGTEADALQALHTAALLADEALVMGVAWRSHQVGWFTVVGYWLDLRPHMEGDYRALLSLHVPEPPAPTPARVGTSAGRGSERRYDVVPHPAAVRYGTAKPIAVSIEESLA